MAKCNFPQRETCACDACDIRAVPICPSFKKRVLARSCRANFDRTRGGSLVFVHGSIHAHSSDFKTHHCTHKVNGILQTNFTLKTEEDIFHMLLFSVDSACRLSLIYINKSLVRLIRKNSQYVFNNTESSKNSCQQNKPNSF
jgi:hypothetical protein